MSDEVKREIPALTSDVSPTAANAFNPLFGTSGVMKYRVALRDGSMVDVEAATGDEAANAALGRHPGGFVTAVNPAPQVR